MELVNIREQLKNNAIEGLYDCVCGYIPEWLKDKVKRCLNMPRFKLIQCNCPISSSYTAFRI